MSALTLAVFLLGAGGPGHRPGTEVRALTVTLLDENGREVTDVSDEDVALLENGVSATSPSSSRDDRPLTVAVLVDTSAAVRQLVPAERGRGGGGPGRRACPTGRATRSGRPATGRPRSWTTPTTGEAAGQAPAARRSPGRQLHARRRSAEASADLKKLAREGDRTAVVAVTGMGPEFSYRDK